MEILIGKTLATLVIGISAYFFAKLRMKQNPEDNVAGMYMLGWAMFGILLIWFFGN